MASIDPERNAIVLRIVYDGPAAAGKTTSVRALGLSLGRPVTTPEAAGERTLFFDWLDYTAGFFEGFQLRCQVVSVPGQALLAKRRRRLIATADAVIFVSPVTAESLSETLTALEDLHGTLSLSSEEPIGIVLQANKRDAAEQLPVKEIVNALERLRLPVAVVESTAISGAGIREAFIFGVRLALDRVREQMRNATLKYGTPEIDGSDDLLRQMRVEEVDDSADITRAGAFWSIPSATTPHVDISAPAPCIGRGAREHDVMFTVPFPPDASVPSGMIWPPIEGRIALRDATLSRAEVVSVDGGWAATAETGWRLHSPTGSVFDEPEAGRAALVQWARLHVQHSAVLSSPRCIALSDDGNDRWRLWQIVRSYPTLRTVLSLHLDDRDADDVAAALVDALVRVDGLDRHGDSGLLSLPLSIDTVGIVDRVTKYVGLFPEPLVELRREHDENALTATIAAIARDFRPRIDEIRQSLQHRRFQARTRAELDTIDRLVEALV